MPHFTYHRFYCILTCLFFRRIFYILARFSFSSWTTQIRQAKCLVQMHKTLSVNDESFAFCHRELVLCYSRRIHIEAPSRSLLSFFSLIPRLLLIYQQSLCMQFTTMYTTLVRNECRDTKIRIITFAYIRMYICTYLRCHRQLGYYCVYLSTNNCCKGCMGGGRH